jgi:bifunctional non-homologous end joining protein LigD
MPAYCKTSGSRGLHIYVPVQQKYTYPQVQNFVKLIEKHIHNQFKDITSFERSPANGRGKFTSITCKMQKEKPCHRYTA